MKKRLGFVSNSSSSSFLITGIEISEKFNIDNTLYFFGKELGDGRDIVHITSREMLALAKYLNTNNEYKICKIDQINGEPIRGFQDYSSCTEVDDMIETYFDKNEYVAHYIINKMKLNKKLKKIKMKTDEENLLNFNLFDENNNKKYTISLNFEDTEAFFNWIESKNSDFEIFMHKMETGNNLCCGIHDYTGGFENGVEYVGYSSYEIEDFKCAINKWKIFFQSKGKLNERI